MIKKYELMNSALIVLLTIILFSGCARTLKDTSGFAEEKVFTVKAPFDKTWQATKETLRELKLEIYTRDKRGVFVAYDQPKREWMQLRRIKYEIQLGSVNSEEIRVLISAIKQVYGVTLLTSPDWHDRKITKKTKTDEIINKIMEKSGNKPETPPTEVKVQESKPSE